MMTPTILSADSITFSQKTFHVSSTGLMFNASYNGESKMDLTGLDCSAGFNMITTTFRKGSGATKWADLETQLVKVIPDIKNVIDITKERAATTIIAFNQEAIKYVDTMIEATIDAFIKHIEVYVNEEFVTSMSKATNQQSLDMTNVTVKHGVDSGKTFADLKALAKVADLLIESKGDIRDHIVDNGFGDNHEITVGCNTTIETQNNNRLPVDLLCGKRYTARCILSLPSLTIVVNKDKLSHIKPTIIANRLEVVV